MVGIRNLRVLGLVLLLAQSADARPLRPGLGMES